MTTPMLLPPVRPAESVATVADPAASVAGYCGAPGCSGNCEPEARAYTSRTPHRGGQIRPCERCQEPTRSDVCSFCASGNPRPPGYAPGRSQRSAPAKRTGLCGVPGCTLED